MNTNKRLVSAWGRPWQRSMETRFGFGGACRSVAAALGLIALSAGLVSAQEGPDPEPGRMPFLVRVELPLNSESVGRVQNCVDRALERAAEQGRPPLIVLEVSPSEEGAGAGSKFEAALKLAGYISGPQLADARTVAYLPQGATGHAVLPVMACDAIYIAGDAEFGEAARPGEAVTKTMREAYVETGRQGRGFPEAVALAMLDSSLDLKKVLFGDGEQFMLGDELAKLEQDPQQANKIKNPRTLFGPGVYARFTGAELVGSHQLADEVAGSRAELADILGVSPRELREDPSLVGEWKAIMFDLSGVIDGNAVSRVKNGIGRRLAEGDVNFICLRIDSAGGSPQQSVELALYLAELDSSKVRTVAYIAEQARADAALVALACDEVVMAETARLGGASKPVDEAAAAPPKQPDKDEQEKLAALQAPVEKLARLKDRRWSLIYALVNPQVEVFRFTRAGSPKIYYMSQAEADSLPAEQEWKRGAKLTTAGGFLGDRARRLDLAAHLDPLLGSLERPEALPRELDELRRAQALNPENYYLNLALGRGLQEEGESSEAIPYLEKAIDLFPSEAGENSPYPILVEALRETGAVDRALGVYSVWWSRWPMKVENALELADLFSAHGRSDEAARVLEESIYADPLSDDLHRRLGELLLAQGDFVGAAREFQVRLHLDPVDRATAYYQLARANWGLEDREAARRNVLLALEIAPGYSDAQKLLLEVVQP